MEMKGKAFFETYSRQITAYVKEHFSKALYYRQSQYISLVRLIVTA